MSNLPWDQAPIGRIVEPPLVATRKEHVAQAIYESWRRRHPTAPTWQGIVAMGVWWHVLAGWMEDAEAALRALPIDDLEKLFAEAGPSLTPELATSIVRGWQTLMVDELDAPQGKIENPTGAANGSEPPKIPSITVGPPKPTTE